MYTSSVDYLSSGEGFTLPPGIIYPLGRGVPRLRGFFIHWGGVYTSSVDYLSLGGVYSLSVDYLSTGGGVHFLRGFFIHLKGVYTSSVHYLSIGEGCTLPPWIIYPVELGVHFLRGLFI